LRHLLSPGLTYPNMFDAHPPFQIDGNFGGAAGIAEMLMQSRLGTVATAQHPTVKPEIEILPALPKAWPTGSVKGLRARGGFEVDATWKDGKLAETTVRALQGGAAQLRCGAATKDITLAKGEVFRWNGQ
jgi:alpha-L-fucosidase 2